MNYAPDDIHRSLRRYVSEALPSWRVWTERDEVRDDARPVAVVEASSPLTQTFARSTVPQGDVSGLRAFSVQCYPELGDTPRDSRLLAEEVAQTLAGLVTLGLVADNGSNIGYPLKVPIYDYANVPLTGANRAGPAEPYGFADIGRGFAVNPIQDPIDPLRWTVALDVQLSWWAAGRGVTDPAATSLHGSPEMV